MNERNEGDESDAEPLDAAGLLPSDDLDAIEILREQGAFAAPPKMKTTRIYYN